MSDKLPTPSAAGLALVRTMLDEEQPSDGRIRVRKLITTETRHQSQTCLNPASHEFDAHHPDASD